MKALQLFSDEALKQAQGMKPTDIVRFLEDFRILHGRRISELKGSQLISIKVPKELLRSFRLKCELEGLRYQTEIKNLMKAWVEGSDAIFPKAKS